MAENRRKRQKVSHSFKHTRKHILEPGQKGFLATCNSREKDCIRESYNILNEYANKIYGFEGVETSTKEDITDEIEQEISALNASSQSRYKRFQSVNTGTNNCIFIQTTLDDHVNLGVEIIKDLYNNQAQRSRFLMRLVPISIVCRATVESIIDSANKLFDNFFLKGNISFCIQFNKRHNNVINRMEVINHLVRLINVKNSTNIVNLKNAELYVIIEIIKGFCLLSVVPDYFKYKKFNVMEICKQSNKSE